MAFNPESIIYLCSVNFDNTYQHQVYFVNQEQQLDYFYARRQVAFSDYLTVRKTLPDGSTESRIKVNQNIESLYNANYMYYRNKERWIFAFITKHIYVNEGTTELRFETDVYQTWRWDTEILQSFVEREHSKTDKIGENIVPEKFTFQDYTFEKLECDTLNISEYGYLVGTSKYINITGEMDSTGRPIESGIPPFGVLHSGIYQGLDFYYFPDINGLKPFMEIVNNLGEDCIEFISVIPSFVVSDSLISGELMEEGRYGRIIASDAPASSGAYLYPTFSYGDDVTIKNNKLYTNPFYNLVISNNAGDTAEYNLEDFYLPTVNIAFKMYADISASPSITLIPIDYKNKGGLGEENTDFGISISGFPQCSYVSDSFKLWLAKNQYSLTSDTLTGLGNIISGIAITAMSGGTAGAIGMGQAFGGLQSVLGTINSTHQAKLAPNSTKGGAPKNNLLTAMGKNVFTAYIRKIKPTYAKIVDDFFTMYGYQTNALKVPNVSSRPYFNYVKTADCNIKGSIPNDDMGRLKAVFNNGITLWKPSATIGDYSVDNSPK